ncbi:MAG: phosphoglycerate kinase [bacterium]|nr:phosphoglycerate kinase [bacterium]
MNFKTISDLKDLRGKKVLLRLDLNVPIKDGVVLDDFRIKSSMPTLNYLKDAGAKVVILSHIGEEGTETLRPVADHLKIRLLPIKIDSALQDEISNMSDGDVVMLENLRQDPREVANDENFAKELAGLGDIYVNDAFSVSHRKHASIVSLPKLLPCHAGFLIQSEVTHLSSAFDPEHPFLFILGGAKFETKINLVRKFIGIADQIFIGGALANTIFKKKGYEVGVSLVDTKEMDLDFVLNNKKIILPTDVSVLDGAGHVIKPADQVLKDENILDIGTESLDQLRQMIGQSKFILWNGPLGNFERGFKSMTEDLARYIADSGIRSIVGGGDTLAAISGLGILDKFTFVSSGGGAMLDFLANGTLPGLEALKNS